MCVSEAMKCPLNNLFNSSCLVSFGFLLALVLVLLILTVFNCYLLITKQGSRKHKHCHKHKRTKKSSTKKHHSSVNTDADTDFDFNFNDDPPDTGSEVDLSPKDSETFVDNETGGCEIREEDTSKSRLSKTDMDEKDHDIEKKDEESIVPKTEADLSEAFAENTIIEETDKIFGLSESFIERSEMTKEKLRQIFVDKETLKWKKSRYDEKVAHATLCKAKETSQVVGYYRFHGECTKPAQKTGNYITIFVLMEGTVSIKIGDESPVLINKLDPVMIPGLSTYSIENLSETESFLLFTIF